MGLRRFEADLARYFTAWLPYSGPSEQDCLAEFGISRQRAAELLLAAIAEASIDEHGPLETLSEHQGWLRELRLERRGTTTPPCPERNVRARHTVIITP